MTYLQQKPRRIVGIDVASASIAVCDADQTVHSIANTRKAIRALLAACRADFIVCEPTGGHERLVLDECLRAGIAVHRADTMKVRSFIRSFGTLAKSDTLDAAMLAAYGRERWKGLKLWGNPDDMQETLRALVQRRSELVAMKVAETNRSKAPGAKQLAASFKAILATIERQIAKIDLLIDAVMAKSQSLRQRYDVCVAMEGIGRRTATSLLALLPELGTMSRRQAASLAGLAPHPNESGARQGYRKMRGGRANIRPVLFMPALRAADGKGEFAAFYKRLVDNGKKPICAIAAVMRKIVITLNARLRDAQIPQS